MVRHILVIRFGSLGDLCLLGWTMSRLSCLPGSDDREVTLVTKQAFAPLAQLFQGVDGVIPLRGGSLTDLRDLAGYLKDQDWHDIFDAHGVLRSHGLLFFIGKHPRRRIAKDTVQRLALLRGQTADPRLQRTMRERFDAVFPDLSDPPTAEGPPPLAHLRPRQSPQPVLGLAPGAQWDTKRWPDGNFAAVLRQFRDRSDLPVQVFLGPREEAWFAGSELASACEGLPDVEIVSGKSLPQVARLLARCTALITNDSGLLHLAEAAGTPVLALFGPTVRQFGYFPCLPDSEVLQVDLDCRPCSRNGKRPCHRGDLACLQRIGPESALPFLQRMFGV